MTKTKHEQQSLHSLLAEHRELMRQVGELRQWWQDCDELGKPNFGEMGARLRSLRELLAAHFRDEEEGGYLAAPLAAAPRFSDEAARLQAQHGRLLAMVEDLASKLDRPEPEIRSWQEAHDELERFLGELKEHEGRENAIVQSAFGDDVGSGD